MSTVDASIPLGVRPFQVEQPANQLAKILQIQNAQQDNQLGRMKMDEYQRGITETNALNQLYQSALKPDGTIDRNALYRGAAERGMGSKLPALQKGFMEQDEAAGKVAKQKIELVDASLKKSRAMLDYVRTPEEYLAWHQANHADPILGPELASRGVTADQAMARIQQALQTPGGFQRLLQESALGLEKFTELNKPHFQKLDSGQQEQVLAIPGLGGAPQTVASVQKKMTPGEIAADARARAQMAQSERHFQTTQANVSRGQFIETPNGYMLADPKTGSVRPVMGPDGQPLKGKAADRQLTDSQAKANLFGSRMQESDRILTDLETKGVKNSGLIKGAVQGTVGMVPFMGDKLSEAAGAGMNTLPAALGGPNSSQQMVEQARRDFLNAVLRRESGAVISPQEFANAEKQYFPQPGDSKDVLAQKQRNRKLAISGMEAEVPGGFKGAKPPEKPAATGGATGEWGGGGGKVVDFGSLR